MKQAAGQTKNGSGIWKQIEWPLQAAGAVVVVALFAGAGLTIWHATRPAPGAVATLSGHPVAHDGDDLRFGAGVRVRLWGIAAPEDRRGMVQPGGVEARAALESLIGGGRVTCDLGGTVAGASLRPVGRCWRGGLDLGEALVRAGFARDCPAFSGGAYAGAEAAARAEGTDLAARYALPGHCGEGE